MKMIDISWPINKQMTEYDDRKSFSSSQWATFEKNDMQETKFCMDSHTGTHVDAPAHFIKGGATIDQIDINQLIGTCQVLDLTHIQVKITAQDLQKCNIDQSNIILLKTKNSNLGLTDQFYNNFVYLDASGAEYLVSKNSKAVGIDYLSIERDQSKYATHVTLLENNVLIIEGLRLDQVESKQYEFVCLPLRFINLEAAPARALLYENVDSSS